MLTLADKIYSAKSPEYRVLCAQLRAGRVILRSAARGAASDSGAAGPQLESVLHSQLTLESLGFVYGKSLFIALTWLSPEELRIAHANLEAMLRRSLGAHQVFKPMYPNFPQQVLEASDAELLANAWMHYLGDWIGLRVLPAYVAASRSPLSRVSGAKPRILTLGSEQHIEDHLFGLINSNVSLSEADRGVLVDSLSLALSAVPGYVEARFREEAAMPSKEVRALIGGLVLREFPALFEELGLASAFGAPTDVLRLAAAAGCANLSTADLTLSAPPRFARIPRGTRRGLLSLINQLAGNSVISEMFQRREQWLRLGEALHPGEYARKFPKALEYFSALRAGVRPASWMGAVETQLHRHARSKSGLPAEKLIGLLAARPGVFARKLHETIRKVSADEVYGVVEAFSRVASQVSTPVLLQLRQRMLSDQRGERVRAFAPKSGAGRMWVPARTARSLSPGIAEQVVYRMEAVLQARFARLPALGKVYVDPVLKTQNVPFGQRTARKALHTLARGSRFPIGEGDVLRAFMWWSESGRDAEGKGYTVDRTDLDLSCAVLDRRLNYIDHCSYTALRTDGLTHSGDITSAPKGACEFIDIDFKALPENAAYLALVVFSYTRQKFADLPEAFAGFMVRKDGQSGEVFDASTVRQKVDLTAPGNRILIGYIDIARREFVWADLDMPAMSSSYNAVESATEMLSILAAGVLAPIRPTMFDLAMLHALARGTLVDDPAEADVVFSGARYEAQDGQRAVTGYDTSLIGAELLS